MYSCALEDEMLGCGATLAKFSAQGHHKVVFMTDGVSASLLSDADGRYENAKNALNTLGVRDFINYTS